MEGKTPGTTRASTESRGSIGSAIREQTSPPIINAMIAFLRGRLISKSPNQAIVDCGGVGYDATISVATFTALPPEGAEARLHIHTHVREDQLALFGFSEPDEKRLFEKLLTISGIGPKLAITVLSGIDASRLVGAIRAGDHATLTRIPGIGKKTAERVVLELKDKLEDMAAATSAGSSAPHYGPAGDDALSALVNLGYPRPLAQKAVEAAMAKEPGVSEDFERLFRAAMAAVK
jgi:holliday junction DNA helicase RuvA